VNPAVCRGSGIFAAALAGAPALAADWSVQPVAQLYAQVESNPQLLADGERSAQSGVADLTLGISRRTELLDMNLNAGGSFRRYGGEVDLDRDDQQVQLGFSRRGERYTLRGNASVTRDTTLTSELGTTGITEYNQRHRARALSLAPTWQASERMTTGLTLGWQDNRYARGPQNGLADYNYFSAAFNSGFEFSEASTVSLVASAGRLDSKFRTDNLDARLQVQHAWSSRWSASLSGGPSWMRTGSRTARGSVFSASLLHQGERLSLDTSLGRSISPTGSGLLSRRDEASLRATFALTEHVNAAASVSAIRSREFIPQFGFKLSDVRYLRSELSLSWRISRDWSLGAGAGNSEQQLLNGATGRNLDARMSLSWRRHNPAG
jgi:hypothetical protein